MSEKLFAHSSNRFTHLLDSQCDVLLEYHSSDYPSQITELAQLWEGVFGKIARSPCMSRNVEETNTRMARLVCDSWLIGRTL